jgi:predicted neutral ceramidase superfamily lipid hydrolase
MNLIFVSDIVLVAVALMWVAIASAVDIKKREVPNWISFSLVAIALAIRGIAAILAHQPFYFFYGLIAFAVGFAIANAFYYGRLFGGGDAKLLMGIMTAFATTPFFAKSLATAEPFLLSFGINLLAIAFVYGVVFGIFAAVTNRKKFSSEFIKNSSKAKKILFCFIALAVVIIAASFFASFKPLLIALALILIIIPFLFIFVRAVEVSSMIKLTSPEKLTEGDMLVRSVKIKNKTIAPCVHGLSLNEIAMLRKAGKSVQIKTGLPFVPVFLVALICALLFGDLLMLLISAMV